MKKQQHKMTEGETVIIAKDVIYQELDGEMVLLDMKSGEYFGIDEVGSTIWALLERGKSTGEILLLLMQEYVVDELTCRNQVASFLNELQGAGLIETT